MTRGKVFGIVAAAAVSDQIIKSVLVALLTPGSPYEIIPGVRLLLIRNSGAAFSMGTSSTWIFTILQAVAALAVLVWGHKAASSWSAIGFSLIGGGAAGNLIDRLVRAPGFGVGHVVDYVSVGSFAIFNLADSCITIGVLCYLVGTLKEARHAR